MRAKKSHLALLSFGVVAVLVGFAPGADEKAHWEVEPDPGEKLQGPFDTKSSIPIHPRGYHVFPTTPSRFVMANPRSSTDVYQVYDLVTMKEVGKPLTIAKRFNGQPPMLSPDGKHVCMRMPLEVIDKNDRKVRSSTVKVWSVETGEVVFETKPEKDNKLKPKFYDLLGGGRLWLAKTPSDVPLLTARTAYVIIDVESGKEITSFDYELVPQGGFHNFSPGRRYQVMEHTEHGYRFVAWDLSTGKMTGHREFHEHKKENYGMPGGIAFSPDGEEMALIWHVNRKKENEAGRLFVFETKTGKKLYDHKLTNDMNPLSAERSRAIQFWPGKRGWLLYGTLLLDRESGKVVHSLNKMPNQVGYIPDRRFLDADHLTNVEGGPDKKLKIMALPMKEINEAVKKARQK